MGSWVRTITSPFRKACTLLKQPKDGKKTSQAADEFSEHEHVAAGRILRGEVMACGYEDVRVMWSMLDKSAAAAAAHHGEGRRPIRSS